MQIHSMRQQSKHLHELSRNLWTQSLTGRLARCEGSRDTEQKMCLDALGAQAASPGPCQASSETCKLPVTCKTPRLRLAGALSVWHDLGCLTKCVFSLRCFTCPSGSLGAMDLWVSAKLGARNRKTCPAPCCWSWR